MKCTESLRGYLFFKNRCFYLSDLSNDTCIYLILIQPSIVVSEFDLIHTT